MIDSSGITGIVVATLGGAAIGVERERSGHASGPHARFGGVRTFTLIGGMAGLAGWLVTLNLGALAIVLTAGAVALIVSGYVAASRQEIDGTSEAAALVVVAAGLVAGIGWLALASGIIAVSVLLLVEKSELHALVGRVGDEELRAAARFAVMATVILPLLPEGPIGPLGIRPRELWLLVLFFTGLSFAGYLARRLFGADRGYPLAGLLGGLISSTNVTFTFARLSSREQLLAQPLAVGAIAACTMLFPRVMIAACVLNLDVARQLAPYLAAPFLIGTAALVVSWRRGPAELAPPPPRPSNPLQIVPALQMAAMFQIVLFAVAAVSRTFGDTGVRAAGAVLGLTDVDALTISMTTTRAPVSAAAAAAAIAIGIMANCVLKAVVAIALGSPSFRRITGLALAAMAVAILVALAFLS